MEHTSSFTTEKLAIHYRSLDLSYEQFCNINLLITERQREAAENERENMYDEAQILGEALHDAYPSHSHRWHIDIAD